MAAVVPLVAHHRLSERFLRVDLAGDPSAAGFACAFDTVRRCRGTWRTRNLLLDLRKVRHVPALNVPTLVGEQLVSALPDVGRIACLQLPETGHHGLRFPHAIRFYVDEVDALDWVNSVAAPGETRASSRERDEPSPGSRLTRFAQVFLQPAYLFDALVRRVQSG